jgi:hypothetical protein
LVAAEKGITDANNGIANQKEVLQKIREAEGADRVRRR